MIHVALSKNYHFPFEIIFSIKFLPNTLWILPNLITGEGTVFLCNVISMAQKLKQENRMLVVLPVVRLIIFVCVFFPLSVLIRWDVKDTILKTNSNEMYMMACTIMMMIMAYFCLSLKDTFKVSVFFWYFCFNKVNRQDDTKNVER